MLHILLVEEELRELADGIEVGAQVRGRQQTSQKTCTPLLHLRQMNLDSLYTIDIEKE
jgi:hypothetical protein